MSAIWCATAWNLPIAWPNCVRVRAYSIDCSSSRSIAPTWLANEADALPVHRVREDASTPPPTPPSTASRARGRRRRRARRSARCAGPSSRTSGPAVKPGVPRSTRNAVTPPWKPFAGSVTAKTIDDVGDRPVGDEHLRAVDAEAVAVAARRASQREGVGAGVRARSWRARRSACRRTGPAGSVASAPRCRASRSARRRRAGARRARTPARRRRTRSPAPRARSRTSADRAAAAVLLRHRQALQAHLAALAPQLAREGLLAIALERRRGSARPGRSGRCCRAAASALGEREVHQASSFRRW